MKKYLFAQIGHRYNYEYAEILYRHHKLYRLKTDLYIKNSDLLSRLEKFNGKLKLRRSYIIDDKFIDRNILLGIKYYLLLKFVNSQYSLSKVLLRFGEEFSKTLRKSELGDGYIGMCSESLEAFKVYKQFGLPCILIQYDPGNDENYVNVSTNLSIFESGSDLLGKAEEYYARLKWEWELADIIIVNSDWSRKCLVEQFVPKEKIRIVPPVYTSKVAKLNFDFTKKNKLKILYVGSVVKRKGTHFFLEFSKICKGKPFEFVCVGPTLLDRDELQLVYPDVNFVGSVPHYKVSDYYRESDILFFPTLSDGFGMVQLEAMAHGLIVFASEYCGEVVRNSFNGFIVNFDQSPLVLSKLEYLYNNQEILHEMKKNAILTIDKYSKEVVENIFLQAIEF
jgi:glycosyltransferase involved in cell wall biosynthesis